METGVNTEKIDVETLEAAINCCRRECAGDGLVLSSDLRVLGDIYGTMIFNKSYKDFDATGFPPHVLETLNRWIARIKSDTHVFQEENDHPII